MSWISLLRVGACVEYFAPKDEKKEYKLLYVTHIQIGPPEIVTGFSLEDEINTTVGKFAEYPWDYSKECIHWENMKKAWVKVTLDPTKLTIRAVTDKQVRSNKDTQPKDWTKGKLNFYRIAHDRKAWFGDGGYAELVFPIWISPRLPRIDDAARLRLLTLLRELSDKRKDFHADSPVCDIIDPDLFPRLQQRYDYLIREHLKFEQRKRRGGDIDSLKREFSSEIRKMKPCDVDEGLKLREQYQWIPSEFLVKGDGSVEIQTPINGITDRQKYKEMYDLIALVFSRMVPLYEKLNLVMHGKPKILQVIVKAQEYNLLPGMSYAGRWHMEGQTENIVAAGVYYLDVGELQGGNLKFRPKLAPQNWYEIKASHEVEIETGTAVVFSNTVPHRFRKIRNQSATNQRRTFLNFFIVDPTHHLPLPSSYVNSDFIRLCLNRYARNTLKNDIPAIVKNRILHFVPYLWANLEEAKEFRHKARLAMLANKSGWGWINWGNCGTTEFVGSWSVWDENKKRECYGGLRHTESE